MQRGDLTKRILEHLIDASADMAYLFAAIVVSPYGSSRKQIERKMQELKEGGMTKSEKERIRRRQQNFYSMIYQLEKQGFIKKTEDQKLLITILGKKKYKKILNHLPKRHYEPQLDSTMKVIIFDIPERQRNKRDWLRRQLEGMEFKMIQKSVWTGKKKISREFLEDLRNLKLLAYVEIFAITKTGSTQLVK